MRRTSRSMLVALAAVSLLFAACSSDDKEASTDTRAESTETTAMEMDAMDIVATASANEDFSTLVTAVKAAGLVETLQGEGPFTVFAPTNEAFDALPEGTLDSLLADPEALKGVLTYHVVPGKVMAADVTTGMVKTVNGKDLDIKVVDGKVTVNGANVVTTDIETSNGVIHVIDKVLVP